MASSSFLYVHLLPKWPRNSEILEISNLITCLWSRFRASLVFSTCWTSSLNKQYTAATISPCDDPNIISNKQPKRDQLFLSQLTKIKLTYVFEPHNKRFSPGSWVMRRWSPTISCKPNNGIKVSVALAKLSIVFMIIIMVFLEFDYTFS